VSLITHEGHFEPVGFWLAFGWLAWRLPVNGCSRYCSLFVLIVNLRLLPNWSLLKMPVVPFEFALSQFPVLI
jgi:hypothetical protein